MKKKTIALAGNPNVGKSTLFNNITGMHQHTGNWSGKTVSNAVGTTIYKDMLYEFIDLPGMYSLSSSSPDEKLAGEFIKSDSADITLIVVDATCLERNLILVKDILQVTSKAILCINLMDEANKKQIHINTAKLENILCIPVIPTSARSGLGIENILESLYQFDNSRSNCCSSLSIPEIINECVTFAKEDPHEKDKKIDKIITSRLYGFPIMLLFLLIIFWLTMTGANYPSSLLSSLFAAAGEKLQLIMENAHINSQLISMLMDGIYKTLTWVIAVMLPPMAIFFPLFTLLEDFGYLPRVAFNLDNFFKKCGAHGKQSLTMCMGFGCNACGVMGCRIIESPRERLIAILTNVFVPCNGRFPTLISLILIFMVTGSGLLSSITSGIILTMIIVFSFVCTFIVSKILSVTLLKGVPSSFVLELPPYRKPQILKVIVRSICDRTLFVLGRAVIVAIPAGFIIWILANTYIGTYTLLTSFTEFLDPFGTLLGVDGVILAAFILGFPANEIVIPIILMCYLSTGTLTDFSSLSQLHDILVNCGWSLQTAISVIILCLFHFPCGTTCLTIKKETGSLKWTALAILIPTITGVLLCLALNILLLAF